MPEGGRVLLTDPTREALVGDDSGGYRMPSDANCGDTEDPEQDAAAEATIEKSAEVTSVLWQDASRELSGEESDWLIDQRLADDEEEE